MRCTETCWSHFTISDRQCFHIKAIKGGNWKPVGEGVGVLSVTMVSLGMVVY